MYNENPFTKREYRNGKRRTGIHAHTANSYQAMREQLWYRHGIDKSFTYETFIALLKEQKYKCAICKCKIDKRAHVDHNHEPPYNVRSLLCIRCHQKISIFHDSVEELNKAIMYLVIGNRVTTDNRLTYVHF